jgi:tRNA dimethylallyltransferase
MELSLERAGDARAVLIAGPTASGKSAAALKLAEAVARHGRAAVIVNADSMQVYDALRILTARPGAAEDAIASHRLYGHVAAARHYSVGAWLRDVEAMLVEADRKGWLPIFVGGTGLYFRALTEGLAAIPAIPAELRAELSKRIEMQGSASLYAELLERDPQAAAAIRPHDRQRLLRALEVLEATGRSITDWRQARTAAPLLRKAETFHMVLEPERVTLHRRIEQRFDAMLKQGAVAEVKALLRLALPSDMPAMKAIGVRELSAFLGNEISLAEAAARATMETRRYAKRQTTWFRNQMRDWERVS